MLELFKSSVTPDISQPSVFILSIFISFLISLLINEIYKISYLKTNVGSGINRFFLIGGPSITAMLIGIQFSLPLSLGLLGALSFVRFRSPIKDPQEIGYILLLIASSICCATLNYLIMVALLATVLVFVIYQFFVNKKNIFMNGYSYHVSLIFSKQTKLEVVLNEINTYFDEDQIININQDGEKFDILLRSIALKAKEIDNLNTDLNKLVNIKKVLINSHKTE